LPFHGSPRRSRASVGLQPRRSVNLPSETPPLTSRRVCSAPPQVLSPAGYKRVTGRGGLRLPRAVSGDPSPGRATPDAHSRGTAALTTAASPAAEGAVCAGTTPQRVGQLARVQHPVQGYARAFPRGNELPRNAQTRCGWQGATLRGFSTTVLLCHKEEPCIPRLKARGFLAHFL
jgi:hypothetical protein